MKKQLLIYLFLMSFTLITNAQILYLPNGADGIGNNNTSSNIGIGTDNPEKKVQINAANTEAGLRLHALTGDNNTNTPYLLLTGGYKPNNGVALRGVGDKVYGRKALVFYSGWDGNTDDPQITDLHENMRISSTGLVGIGTSTPAYKLDVVGTVRANEIKVDLNGADFVFEKDYHLMPLNELEKFVKEQKHLPEIAPAGEMTENGTGLGDLNTKLLQKIEELTLYVIQKDKEVKQLMDTRQKDQKEKEKLENQIKALSERLEKIEALISSN